MLHYPDSLSCTDLRSSHEQDLDLEDYEIKKVCIICNHLISPEYIYRYIYCLKCIKQCRKLFCDLCNDYFCNKEKYCDKCKRREKIRLIKNTRNTICNTFPVEIVQMILNFL